jgi:acetyl esterase/lipase
MRCLTLVVFAILAAPLLADENRRYADIEYARVGQTSLRLDLYVPKVPAPPPLVLYIHGGDWMYGNKRLSPPLFLLDHGLAVASIDYRLAPRSRFPAQIQDCRDALMYLYANAARYRFNGSRIGVMGESAGGHLAALLATADDVKTFEGTRRPKDRPRILAAASLSGPMDLETLADLGDSLEDVVGRNPIQNLLGGRMKDKRALAQLASPIRHVSPGDPPMLLIYGEQDIVVPSFQAQRMQEAMESAGVPVKTVAIPRIGHDMAAIWQTQTPEHIARFLVDCLILRKPPTTRPATRSVHATPDEPFIIH